jgi:hypothetical protein
MGSRVIIDMVLDVAINGRVDVIVTHNVKHLHVLAVDVCAGSK